MDLYYDPANAAKLTEWIAVHVARPRDAKLIQQDAAKNFDQGYKGYADKLEETASSPFLFPTRSSCRKRRSASAIGRTRCAEMGLDLHADLPELSPTTERGRRDVRRGTDPRCQASGRPEGAPEARALLPAHAGRCVPDPVLHRAARPHAVTCSERRLALWGVPVDVRVRELRRRAVQYGVQFLRALVARDDRDGAPRCCSPIPWPTGSRSTAGSLKTVAPVPVAAAVLHLLRDPDGGVELHPVRQRHHLRDPEEPRPAAR